ncbi:putative nuclease HARBI1 [Portunus trituberculatus]|uniref:putative nuclease HARBI1 n=1 Tax=Portunus trituberculatus TaxID=210409 RepID=UPI001E1CB6DC|nr:putative nuclease HARBI1 [Portunus trituberculatus]
MQRCSGDDFGVSQPTISRVIWQTITALTAPRVFHQFLKFPLTRQEVQRKQVEFMAIAGFPGVVGVIDGTHVRIVAPKDDKYAYVNRKRYHSINVQVVFDATYKILDIVAKWPGSVHDARILNESGLKMLFEDNYVPQPCHLLGDSGYPFKQWLLTPYTNRQLAGPQANYNRAHKRTRSVVERGIEQWKRRFHVLHNEVRVAPDKVCKVIYACAILHNFCKNRGIPLPDADDCDDGAE